MRKSAIIKLVYRSLGGICVALATAGVFLPILPTTPFLIVAVWAFLRSSPELAERLRDHPRFGPYLRDWEERRAIPRPAKAASIIGMGTSWVIVLVTTRNLWIAGLMGATLIAVAAYILTRPSA